MQHEKSTLENNGTLSEWIPSGLLELSNRMVFQPSTLALFGDVDPPSIEKDFQLFDNSFHYFYADIPRRIFAWLFPEELKARARLNASWLKNLHPNGESELMQARKILFHDNAEWFSDQDLGGSQTGIFWGSLGNTIPAVCWTLFYILQDTKAVETIQREIDTNLPFLPLDNDSDSSLIEEWTPEQLNSCVYLESAVYETLRMAGAPLLTRRCDKETQIVLQDGRTLIVKPNEIIAYFAGVTHLDANLFPEPNKFIFDRFVNKTAETVPGFIPFGAGKNMCPGRFFAKNEMKICLAMLLRYMEYKFIGTKVIPKQKPQRIGFGVAPPNEDIPIMYRYKV
jgi:cytochrome P450